MSKQDYIEQLPTDESEPNVDELYLVNTMFSNNDDTARVFDNFKETIVVGFLFILLNMPFINNIIKSSLRFTENSFTIFVFVKAIICMILFFVINNFALCRNVG